MVQKGVEMSKAIWCMINKQLSTRTQGVSPGFYVSSFVSLTTHLMDSCTLTLLVRGGLPVLTWCKVLLLIVFVAFLAGVYVRSWQRTAATPTWNCSSARWSTPASLTHLITSGMPVLLVHAFSAKAFALLVKIASENSLSEKFCLPAFIVKTLLFFTA